MAKGEHPNLIVIGYTPSHQLVWIVFKQIWVIKIIFLNVRKKFLFFVDTSIGVEFDQSPDNLLCPRTRGSDESKKLLIRETVAYG